MDDTEGLEHFQRADNRVGIEIRFWKQQWTII